MNKIVLAGGSGQLGRAIANYFQDKVKEIVILSRSASASRDRICTVQWDGIHQGSWISELENADLLINLTGKNVNCRYTKKNKEEIVSSRVDSVKALGIALQNVQNPPRVWIQSSSATIYRHALDRPMDEEHGEIGEGFSVDVCQQWEKAFNETALPQVRKIIMRTAIVFSKNGGAIPRLVNLVRAGLGGKQGNGMQRVSWIHEEDVARIIEWMYENQNVSGVYNCAAPHVITNSELMFALRKSRNRSWGVPTPAWLLELGAVLIGTETELILKSRWVASKRLLQQGYRFEYPTLNVALRNLNSKQ